MNKIFAGEKTRHVPTDCMSLLEPLQPRTQIAALRTEMNLPIILEVTNARSMHRWRWNSLQLLSITYRWLSSSCSPTALPFGHVCGFNATSCKDTGDAGLGCANMISFNSASQRPCLHSTVTFESGTHPNSAPHRGLRSLLSPLLADCDAPS